MTNFDKWKSYTDGLPSPNNFITWGWIYMIGAALQRRVWCPPAHDPMFANQYTALVGEAGIGKGGVIRAVQRVLTHYKLRDIQMNGASKISDADKATAEAILKEDLKAADKEIETAYKTKEQKSALHEALLFPDAPDATSYQALVLALAQSYRHIPYVAFDEKQQKNVLKAYGHSSMYFCLEELESIFKRNTEELNTFLRQAYDCADTYRYKTISRGEDRVKKVCLSFLCGTTPDFMQSSIDNNITTNGFSSRTFYIFSPKNRKAVGFRPELTPEQHAHFKDILEHINKLAHLYGQVQLDNETVTKYNNWCREDFENPGRRASQSAKLKSYYSRKNIHIMKVAMALHFGESTEMYIPWSTFEQAIALLHEEEKTMALALMMGERNPLAKPSHKIMDYLRLGKPRTFEEIQAEFWGELRRTELEEVLAFLEQTDKIEGISVENETTKTKVLKYKVL